MGNSNVPPAPTTGGMTNSGIKIQDLVQRPVSTATAATAVASSPQKEMEKEVSEILSLNSAADLDL